MLTIVATHGKKQFTKKYVITDFTTLLVSYPFIPLTLLSCRMRFMADKISILCPILITFYNTK